MATRWYYKAFGQELGPMPFGELVQLARCGELTTDDWVRAAHEGDWRRAETVVGLFYMARRTLPHASESSEEGASAASAVTDQAEPTPVELAAVEPSEPEMPRWLMRILERLRAGELDPQRARQVLSELMAIDHRLSEDAAAFLADASGDESGEAAVWLAADASRPAPSVELQSQLTGAIEEALAEIDGRVDAEPQVHASRLRRIARGCRDLLADRGMMQYGFRLVGAMIAGNAALLWLDHWTTRQALRFPGLLEKQGVRMFPAIGECEATEYWFFAVDLAIAAAVAAYLGIRWVERRLE
jgi:hypothetical protein